MVKGGASYRVKLITGPHAGAEVEMDGNDARLTLGSGDGAELLLSDALVQPLHAELTYDKGQVFVKSLSGKTFLNGKLLQGENPTVVGDFQFVTVGATHILIGPIDGEWSNYGPNDVPNLEVEESEVPKEIFGKADLSAEPATLRAARREVETARRRKRRARLLIFVGGIFLVAMLAILCWPKKRQIGPADIEKAVRTQLATMEQFPAVTVRAERGQVVVDGYVPTNIDLRDLRTILQAAYPSVHCVVRSQERVTSAVEDLLRTMSGCRLQIIQMQPGAYVIEGYVYDEDAWQKVRSRISTDVPGVRKIQNDVLTPSQVLESTREMLGRHGLARQITVLPMEEKIFFQGKISALQMEQWKSAAEDFIQTFSNHVALEFDVQTLSAQTETSINAFFPEPIRSITIGSGGLSWVATGDGRKYFNGAFLPSGWRMDGITADGLSFSREGRRINMRLDGLR
ncbi:MAG: type III secretion system inner membrane ring subunit SctD [Puniceicoccales bacterium]|jgi:type III secretion system YscD/HrpQ family protein|nr:type III secretion system inner membrane ring subunit SctD [Puniceicoccales bacterium]